MSEQLSPYSIPKVLHRPKAAVLKVVGSNDDANMRYGYELAGAEAEIVHLNEFLTGLKNPDEYDHFGIPGGFTYGDDFGGGDVMAMELHYRMAEMLQRQLERGKVILGICNGFQVLTQSGLLPFGKMTDLDQISATLGQNASGKFESRWVRLKPENMMHLSSDETLILPVAHGEGRFFAHDDVMQQIEEQGLVAWRYCTDAGEPTQEYPANPNGSLNAIAGITNKEGNIIGLMPHPDRVLSKYNYNNWRRDGIEVPHGQIIFNQVFERGK